MSSRRGLLVQPSRRRQTGGESAVGDSTAATNGAASEDRNGRFPSPEPLLVVEYEELPAYEPLQEPLTDLVMRKINDTANRSALPTRAYEKNLKQSADLLRESIGGVHDVLSERAAQLHALEERRRERGRDEPSAAEVNLARMVAQLTERAAELTNQLEAAARKTIDMQMELQDGREALSVASTSLTAWQIEDRRRRREQQQRRQQEEEEAAEEEGSGEEKEGEEGEKDDSGSASRQRSRGKRTNRASGHGADGEATPPPMSAVDALGEARSKRADDYARMTAHQKYGLNNDYIAFKQTWHEAMYPEGDVILPDASAWFNADGRPAKYGPNAGSDAGKGGSDGSGGDDSGDDLVVEREVISFRCPLTLVTMTDPLQSRKCNHTFEREAIMQYLATGPMKCPQTGCDEVGIFWGTLLRFSPASLLTLRLSQNWTWWPTMSCAGASSAPRRWSSAVTRQRRRPTSRATTTTTTATP